MGARGARTRLLLAASALLIHASVALDAPDSALPSSGAAPAPMERRPNPLLAGFQKYIQPPMQMFREAPPITRSWVSGSIVMAALTSSRVIDLRRICFSERDVVHNGEWWRLLTNFFFMGDALRSIFFWMQIYHFWECLKVLELVKYRWEPADFIKMIVCNAAMLLCLKQLFPALIFLGSPMVMAFVYMYSREYEAQVMNLLGFFQIRCGWLPFSQMLQDLLQAGDIGPNLLGLVSGHTYFYFAEVVPRLLLPSADEMPLDKLLDGALSGLIRGESLFPEVKAEAEGDGDGEGDDADAGEEDASDEDDVDDDDGGDAEPEEEEEADDDDEDDGEDEDDDE